MTHEAMKIAVLGATSHIAKGLIACWLERQDRELLLYARSPERVQGFLGQFQNAEAKVLHIDEYGREPHDVVVNCVGIGSPQKLQDNFGDIFRITTVFDDLILNYLAYNPQTIYINLSSGAAYGSDFSQPVCEQSQARFNINSLNTEEFYGIAKLHSEARHRSLKHLNIVDLRIFGYFSRYIDLDERFLLSEIISCIKNRKPLITSPINIWRDYLHPQDLAMLVDCCITHCPLNNWFDAYSNKEISKFDLLAFFVDKFGLEYRIDKSYRSMAVTGQKNCYYTAYQKAREVGYIPEFSSMEGIKTELHVIFKKYTEAKAYISRSRPC